MAHLLKAGGLTVDMIERRDFVRRLYGDRFEEKMELPKAIIRNLKKQTKKSTLAVALEIAKEAVANGNGSAVNSIIAAVVEMIEAGEV